LRCSKHRVTLRVIAVRRIAEIFDEFHLTVEEANPGRTQDGFERALAQLQSDGSIGPVALRSPTCGRDGTASWFPCGLALTRAGRPACDSVAAR